MNEIRQQKEKDVEQILTKQFGDQWAQNPELEWFNSIIFNEIPANISTKNEVDDDVSDADLVECHCCEPDQQDFV